jgi:hypothetical protein
MSFLNFPNSLFSEKNLFEADFSNIFWGSYSNPGASLFQSHTHINLPFLRSYFQARNAVLPKYLHPSKGILGLFLAIKILILSLLLSISLLPSHSASQMQKSINQKLVRTTFQSSPCYGLLPPAAAYYCRLLPPATACCRLLLPAKCLGGPQVLASSPTSSNSWRTSAWTR